MNLLQRIKNDEILSTIRNDFPNEVYLVGGAVRDFVLGKNTLDRDLIVCDEDARSFAIKLSERFNATFVPLDEINKILNCKGLHYFSTYNESIIVKINDRTGSRVRTKHVQPN